MCIAEGKTDMVEQQFLLHNLAAYHAQKLFDGMSLVTPKFSISPLLTHFPNTFCLVSSPWRFYSELMDNFVCLMKESMGPRWKGKTAEAAALADPMSKIVSRLQSSFIESDSHGILSGCSVLLAAHQDQTEILNQACFGRPIITAEKDKQWFQLSLEEAFYLCYEMKCIKIVRGNNCPINDTDLWQYMTSKKDCFRVMFKAYSHLRMKNWVVRAGSQYGVDFVAYRHHPALVHSEYAVLVMSEEDGDVNGRLRVWSDFHCTLRLCGSVAKALLVLFISKNGDSDDISPSCMENYSVEERIITRWIPEQSRENQGMEHKESCMSQT